MQRSGRGLPSSSSESAPGWGCRTAWGPTWARAPAGPHRRERNCVSGIRPEGLPVSAAAELLAWLVGEALRRGLTGVGLKDERAFPGPAPVRSMGEP